MKNFFTHNMRKKSPLAIVGMVILGAVAISGLAILFGFIIMWLWNWLMPDLFGFPELTYWKAVGLFILLKILLGGIGGGGHSKNSSKNECKKSNSKNDFSKWEHYDKFWKEEGNAKYQEFLDKIKSDHSKSNEESDTESNIH